MNETQIKCIQTTIHADLVGTCALFLFVFLNVKFECTTTRQPHTNSAINT